MTTITPPPVRPPRQRRSRARTLVPLAVAAWAVLEIWLLILVAGATNGFVVLLCILAGFVLGAAAIKRAGRSAWRNLTASVAAAQRAAGDGDGVRPGDPGEPGPVAPGGRERNGLAMLGGVLLIIPGFISDVLALVLLFPPTRRFTGRRIDKAVLGRTVPVPPGTAAGGPTAGGPGGGKVVQGEVINRD